MCDFQYLPVGRAPSTGTPQSILHQLTINSFLPECEVMSRSVPLFLPPVVFSRLHSASQMALTSPLSQTDDKKTIESYTGSCMHDILLFVAFSALYLTVVFLFFIFLALYFMLCQLLIDQLVMPPTR